MRRQFSIASSRNKANALEVHIHRWLQKYAAREFRALKRVLLRDGIEALASSRFAKEEDPLIKELERLLRKFGLMQLNEAGERIAGNDWILKPDLIDEVLQGIQSKVVLLIEDTRDSTQQAITDMVKQALSEQPQPTPAELGRRIARSWFGPAKDLGPTGLRGTPAEASYTADWRRNQLEMGPDEREYLFSFTRARTIARTEMAQAQNMGIVAGMTEVGVEAVKWLARYDDGRSGPRRHYEMNDHEPILVADMNSSDTSKWFMLPRGERCPYPQWPGLSASEIVNCRCKPIPA